MFAADPGDGGTINVAVKGLTVCVVDAGVGTQTRALSDPDDHPLAQEAMVIVRGVTGAGNAVTITGLQGSTPTVTADESTTLIFRVSYEDNTKIWFLFGTSAGGGEVADVQYAVDEALGATPTGTVAIAKRDDALSALTPIEGDAVELRVDANGALWVIPSGTTTISGTVTANAGTDLNTSLLALESGGNLAASAASLALIDNVIYVDDADWTDGVSSHVLIGGLYQTVPQSITDGDVGPLQVDVNGNLKVNIAAGSSSGTQYTEGDTDASITGTAILWEDAADTLVTASASTPFPVEIVAGAGSGGTAAADDADFTPGTTSGTPVMGAYESTPTSVTDGDLGMIGITQTRAVRTVVENTVTVASHAVTNAGTFVVQIDGAALTALQLIDNIVHVDDAAFTLGTHSGVMMMGFAGTQSVDANDAAALACTTAGALHVADAGGSLTVDNDGTFAVQVSSLPASTNTIEVVGDAAHGAAVAGNPLLVGVEGRSTAPTAVDDGDVVRALATLLGKQVVYPYALPASSWSYASPAAVTDTADDEAKAAVASTRNYITRIQVFNGHDTVGTEVVIKDGSTVLWRGWAEQTGGGCSAVFDPPLRGTANTAVNVANITTGSATYFNLQGFVATE